MSFGEVRAGFGFQSLPKPDKVQCCPIAFSIAALSDLRSDGMSFSMASKLLIHTSHSLGSSSFFPFLAAASERCRHDMMSTRAISKIIDACFIWDSGLLTVLKVNYFEKNTCLLKRYKDSFKTFSTVSTYILLEEATSRRVPERNR